MHFELFIVILLVSNLFPTQFNELSDNREQSCSHSTQITNTFQKVNYEVED